MRKKEERRKVYFCKVSSSGYQIDLYIFFFHSLILYVKAGIIYNISKVKCILEKTYSLLKIEKKKNRDDECVSFIKKIVYTRSRVII